MGPAVCFYMCVVVMLMRALSHCSYHVAAMAVSCKLNVAEMPVSWEVFAVLPLNLNLFLRLNMKRANTSVSPSVDGNKKRFPKATSSVRSG